MRTSIPLALLGAAFVAALGTAQAPPGVAIDAQATSAVGLTIKHDGPAGLEIDMWAPGTVFGPAPLGPACPHWPADGAGVQYYVQKGPDGFEFVGKEMLRAFAGSVGETGRHDNVLIVRAEEGCVPAFVDVEFKSLVDANFWHAWAKVDVVGYELFVHNFGIEYEKFTVPVMLDRMGLEVHVLTHMHVDNQSAPTFQGLVDLDFKVTVRLPEGKFVTGGVGCPGSNGVPEIEAIPGQVPVVGEYFTAKVINLPLNLMKPAYGLISTERLRPPIDLGLIGLPGCELYVYTPLVWPLEKLAGEADWTIFVPMAPRMVGAQFYLQVAAFDELPFGLAFSNYGEGTIGAVPFFVP